MLPETVSHNLVKSKTIFRQKEISLIGRSTLKPKDAERGQALKACWQALIDFLD